MSRTGSRPTRSHRDRPALYQVQIGETAGTSQKTAGLPCAGRARDLVIYTPATRRPPPCLDRAKQFARRGEAALPMPQRPGETLGGKVYTARIDGKIEIVENVAGHGDGGSASHAGPRS